MHLLRGMETSLGHASKKFWKVNMSTRGMLVEVLCHVDELGSPHQKLPTVKKKNNDCLSLLTQLSVALDLQDVFRNTPLH